MADNKWSEKLPANCPPSDAFEPNNMVFFRLVEAYPPSEVDFLSVKRRSPNRQHGDECILKACSVFSSYDSCDVVRKAYRNFRNMLIVKIVLPPHSGVVLQTFNDPNHYSWWISKGFNPIEFCQEIQQSGAK